ncbi:TIGR03986 family CRISPR-associated RAMP protein [Nonomuraea sp. NPDC049714]|uniref:TIGR03986 family type III CRISPR-associated RAMP protein n=1 Tax=Nonomuraea sp. NPDC049714 TaxID=3364357 RepID=UPI00379DF994
MMAEGFLNPYTFVPAFPRDGLPEPLRDGPPPSRARLHPERWSGRIEVALTTETPLLLLDPARAHPPSSGEEEHNVYPVRLRDGRPYLASTAVKGMLRSAFETVTNSRFGVFHGHEELLGFRRDAGFALKLQPVRVAGEGALEEYKTALLQMYDDEGNLLPGPQPRHMEKLQAVIKRKGKNSAKVERIKLEGDNRRLRTDQGERRVDGIAYVTGRTVEGKRFERLFYSETERPKRLKLGRAWKDIISDWDRLIVNYKRASKNGDLRERSAAEGHAAERGERIADGLGQPAWNPHIHDDAYQKLKVGTLCYAFMRGGRVERLYPVLIPRDVYPISPTNLLDESLAPVGSYEDMSPADRLFGWVDQSGKNVRTAYRGRLRIGPVTCLDTAEKAVLEFPLDGLPLAILSAPKPQQGRFYVAESNTRPDQPIQDGTTKADIYRHGRGLRGRKVYWHHAGLDAERHWKPNEGTDPTQVVVGGRYREYLRPRTLIDDSKPLTPDRRLFATAYPEQRDSQNRSISGWVLPGTTFRFTVEVRDVDKYELGALAWLLTLPAGHFHRLGFGRPLGFGSVRLDIEEAELHDGTDYMAYYQSLSEVLPESDWRAVLDAAREAFNSLVEASPALKTVREAILAASRGVPTLPVHYPRLRHEKLDARVSTPPDPQGLQYKWFTANEKIEKGVMMDGRGRSLPRPVGSEPPLEIYLDENGNASASRDTGGRSRSRNGKIGHQERRANRKNRE